MNLRHAAVKVRDFVKATSPLSATPVLSAFVATVELSGRVVDGFPAGTPVILAGEPTSPDTWHIDRVLVCDECNPEMAGRIVLLAHLLYLLRKARIQPGETVFVSGNEIGRDILKTVVKRYCLQYTDAKDAEVLVLAGDTPDGLYRGDCRTLQLAGEAPRGLDVVTGPAPVTDLRTQFTIGSPRWPMARCLALAQKLDLGGSIS